MHRGIHWLNDEQNINLAFRAVAERACVDSVDAQRRKVVAISVPNE